MKKILVMLILTLGAVSLVVAQPGGGRGGNPLGGGGNPPTGGERPNPPALGGGDGTMPQIGEGNFTIPENLPTSPEELQAMLESGDLPISLDDLPIPESSAEAYAAIVGFASTYLGTSLDPLYTGEVGAAQASVAANAPSTVDTSEVQALIQAEIMGMIPEEVQLVLATASSDGLSYYGIMQNGLAAVYTADSCTGANCSVSMEQLQLTITSSSLGAYVLLSDSAVSNSNDAYTLIINSFPLLAYENLEPVESDTGYMFSATNYSDSEISALLAGVISTGEQTIVYVALGVGETYAEIVRN